MEDHDDESQQIHQRAAAAGTGALIGLAVGGPAGAIAGAMAAPVLEPFMARVWDELRSDGRARAGAVLRTATDSLGEDDLDFERRVQATAQSRLLAATAMDGGMRTAWHPKLRALGRALAAGLADDCARVDEQQLIVGALADLEAPHARVLDLLITKKWAYGFRPKAPHEQYWEASGLLDQERPPRRYPQWAPDQIGSALPNLEGIVPTILGTLQRHGLAVPKYDLRGVLDNLVTDNNDGSFEISTDGPDEPTITWSATELGLQLHKLLRHAVDEPGEHEAAP